MFPLRTCWHFDLFRDWTCDCPTRWTGTVVWRHPILEKELLWGLPVTWGRTLCLHKCRAGVVSLLSGYVFGNEHAVVICWRGCGGSLIDKVPGFLYVHTCVVSLYLTYLRAIQIDLVRRLRASLYLTRDLLTVSKQGKEFLFAKYWGGVFELWNCGK